MAKNKIKYNLTAVIQTKGKQIQQVFAYTCTLKNNTVALNKQQKSIYGEAHSMSDQHPCAKLGREG